MRYSVLWHCKEKQELTTKKQNKAKRKETKNMKNITRTIKKMEVEVKVYNVTTDNVENEVIILLGTEKDFTTKDEIVKETEKEFKNIYNDNEKVMIKYVNHNEVILTMFMPIDTFYKNGNLK